MASKKKKLDTEDENMSWMDRFDLSPVMNLRNITRYSNIHLIEAESVTTHTIEMQLMAITIYEYFKKNDETFDLRDVAFRILMHDLDETVTCDIPRDIKYHDDNIHKEIDRVTSEKLQALFDDEIVSYIHSAKDATFEGRLVSYIDIIQAGYRLSKEYKLQHNGAIKKRLNQSYVWMSGMRKNLIKEIATDNLDKRYELIYDILSDVVDEIRIILRK